MPIVSNRGGKGTHLVHLVLLLQHVVPHHGGGELHEEPEHVHAGGFDDRVFDGEGVLQRPQHAETRQSLQQARERLLLVQTDQQKAYKLVIERDN